MPKEKLPVVSGKQAVSAFKKDNWILLRLSKKGHFILGKTRSQTHLSIPNHKKLDRGLLRDLIRDANLSPEEFRELLRIAEAETHR